jgi:plastocyanin
MSELIRSLYHRPGALLVPTAVLLALAAVGFSVVALARPQPGPARTITLEVRDMAFYLAGEENPNPRLQVARGEQVRLVLRNEDAGRPHDLNVQSLGLATRMLRETGESAALTLRAPAEPGEHDYVCSLHAQMMRGVLEVR